jgi:hypothetical protein
MAKIEQFSRLINHRVTTSGQLFTIPTSNDHTDETWLSTDLYIGEIGINVTDDKAYFRTNNGIVQIATGTSSGGSTSSQSNIWVFNSPNIQIGSTYSADAIIPKSGYYTDLGSTTLPFKDLYLGGAAGGQTTIDTNIGVYLKTATDGILTSDGVASSNAPIEIHTNSSNANKDRPLFLNVRYGQVTGSGNYVVGMSTNTLNFTNNAYVVGGAGTSITFEDGISYATHWGRGLGRSVYENDMHVVSGKQAVKGFQDDGTGQYNQSEWITTQNLLRTTDANFTDIVNLPWTATASGGNVIQVKAYLVGTLIDDASQVYSAEIMGCYSIDDNNVAYEIGTPILNAVSSWSGTQPDCEMAGDVNGFYIKVKGVGTSTIQWLCSYSYHKLINIV